jgi:predicted 2-oxoglutarate/Fe(II)-dependent dioxygenase YbiX
MSTTDFWSWKNMLSKKELIKLHKTVQAKYTKNYKDRPAERSKKVASVKGIQYCHVKDQLSDICQRVYSANNYHFGYNLYEINAFDNFLYTEYDSKHKGEYDWHVDGSNNYINDVKLTMLINTSLNKYEGGDFLFFLGKPTLIKEFQNPGDVIIFKSSIYHKVTPLTKGSRSSLAFFLTGPRLL